MAHGTQLLTPEDIVLAGSEECLMEKDFQNIKFVDSSVGYNTRPKTKTCNMWLSTNILKMHHKGLPIKKIKHKQKICAKFPSNSERYVCCPDHGMKNLERRECFFLEWRMFSLTK